MSGPTIALVVIGGFLFKLLIALGGATYLTARKEASGKKIGHDDFAVYGWAIFFWPVTLFVVLPMIRAGRFICWVGLLLESAGKKAGAAKRPAVKQTPPPSQREPGAAAFREAAK